MHPDAYTIAEHKLAVGDGHTLYVHDWGNARAATPIMFLHGGPGSECKDKHKTTFDPVTQRVIFHDQRGAGQSTPAGSLSHNTTADLAADITRIADELELDEFILTGQSWGSCLALYYTLQEPKRVKALVIGGVFTGSSAEVNWINHGLFKNHFPDVWERYVAATPAAHRDDPSAYHFERALGSDAAAAKQSAYVYDVLEGSILQLNDEYLPEPYDSYDPAGTQIEMSYLANGLYLPDNYILDNAQKLTMPLYIVQGRYDFVCPPSTAYTLSQRAPNARLIWSLSGHRSEHENGTALRLIFQQLTSAP